MDSILFFIVLIFFIKFFLLLEKSNNKKEKFIPKIPVQKKSTPSTHTQIYPEPAEIIGREGEYFFNKIAKSCLNNDYFVLDNIVLKAGHGTTQIDQIIVSKFGIFVVEIKNYKGWIFGDVDDTQWTQTLTNGKYQFQNPLKQNYKHVKAVQSLLGFSDGIKSLIVFSDSAEFKTQLANNVVIGEIAYINFIKKHRQILLSDYLINNAIKKLKTMP